MAHAYKLCQQIRRSYTDRIENTEELKTGIKKSLLRLGILTEKVRGNVNRLEKGVVETGQQPMVMGGPSLILNKIAYTYTLSTLGEDGFVPLFYVADYDGIHSELLNIRIPSPSIRGLLISYPADEEYKDAPIYELPNPPEKWLRENLERVAGNYRMLLNEVGKRKQERAQMNLEHCFTIIKNAYYSTDSVSDFATKILGSIVNIEADMGIPFLISSEPEIRRLFQPGYEILLSEPNRTKFLKASNHAVEEIKAAGYNPQIGYRGREYVPFFLECKTEGCHRRRIEVKYHKKAGGNAEIMGKCPKCREVYIFDFDAENPDLTEIINRITPRVDSRQIIIDSVVPVLAHVGGPGETGYYSEVIPGAKAMGIQFPVYLRYNRTWYNTPWNEKLSRELERKDVPTILSEDLFQALSIWIDARNNEDNRKMKEAHNKIRKSIMDTYGKLIDKKRQLEEEIKETKSLLNKAEERQRYTKNMQEKQKLLQKLEMYLSWAFGRFTPEKFGQEVNWLWVDAGIVAGVGDILGMYLREYKKYTPNSSMFFVNL